MGVDVSDPVPVTSVTTPRPPSPRSRTSVNHPPGPPPPRAGPSDRHPPTSPSPQPDPSECNPPRTTPHHHTPSDSPSTNKLSDTSPSGVNNVNPKLLGQRNVFHNTHLQYYYSIPVHVENDPVAFLTEYRNYFIEQVRQYFNNYGPFPPTIRILCDIPTRLVKMETSGEINYKPLFINLDSRVTTIDDVEDLVDFWIANLIKFLEKHMNDVEGSGLVIDRMLEMQISYLLHVTYNLMGDYVPYPSEVRGDRMIFNPKGNGENSCVVQAIAAYLFHKDGLDWRHMQRRVGTLLNCMRVVTCKGLNFPLTWDDLAKIENLNKVSLFVYTLTEDAEEKKRFYLSLSRKGNKKYKTIIPLLLLEGKHIALIKDLPEYYRTLKRMDNFPAGHKLCRTCLNLQPPHVDINEHECDCTYTQTLVFPPKNTFVRFKNYAYAYPPSHLAFFDIETMAVPTGNNGRIVAEHQAIGYSYIIVNKNGDVVKKDSYVGQEATQKLYESMSNAWRDIKANTITFPIHMTPQDELRFKAQKQCELCHITFTKDAPPNRHHDHSIQHNNYLGAYCARCNFQCKNMLKYLPALAHNMSFDVGVMLKEIKIEGDKVSLCVKSGTSLFKVRMGEIQFMDSLSIMNASLKSLADTHVAAGYPTKYTHEMVDHLPEEVRNFITTKKQIFCYEYITSMDRLQENCLPPREAFYNSLTEEELSEEDYEHALRVWEMTECQTLADYVKMYCQVDTGLLADTYLKYRETLMSIYTLDPSHYVSLSSYAYDAFLFYSKVIIDAPHDNVLYNLIRKHTRGGFVSCITPLMKANFDQDTQGNKNYILYKDFNSLYASVMCQNLPYGNIRQLEEREMNEFLDKGILNHPTDGSVGYWLEIDSHAISPEIARLTDEFPLALTHMRVTNDHLSPYSKHLLEEMGRKSLPKKNVKLIASHKALKNHLISLPLLQLLMDLGLKVRSVHRIYRYSQSCYLQSFIERNVEERSKTSCGIANRVFKLMSNAIYGRSLMNEVRYGEVHRFVTNKLTFLRTIKSPAFKRVIPLGENRVITVSSKEKINITQPNFVGFQVLELAKVAMYRWFYKVLKANYPQEKSVLAYMDTDSYIFSISINNGLYDELRFGPMSQYIDFSNFPHDHPLYNNQNKGKLGLLKSETGAKLIKECVILKPKMYSILLDDEEQISRGKGIPRRIQSKINHQKYKDTLLNSTVTYFRTRTLTRVNGQMCTVAVRRKGLCPFDDKRYYVDAYTTRAYYHPDNEEIVDQNDTEDEGEVEVRLEEHTEESEPWNWDEVEDGGMGGRGPGRSLTKLWGGKRMREVERHFPKRRRVENDDSVNLDDWDMDSQNIV